MEPNYLAVTKVSPKVVLPYFLPFTKTCFKLVGIPELATVGVRNETTKSIEFKMTVKYDKESESCFLESRQVGSAINTFVLESWTEYLLDIDCNFHQICIASSSTNDEFLSINYYASLMEKAYNLIINNSTEKWVEINALFGRMRSESELQRYCHSSEDRCTELISDCFSTVLYDQFENDISNWDEFEGDRDHPLEFLGFLPCVIQDYLYYFQCYLPFYDMQTPYYWIVEYIECIIHRLSRCSTLPKFLTNTCQLVHLTPLLSTTIFRRSIYAYHCHIHHAKEQLQRFTKEMMAAERNATLDTCQVMYFPTTYKHARQILRDGFTLNPSDWSSTITGSSIHIGGDFTATSGCYFLSQEYITQAIHWRLGFGQRVILVILLKKKKVKLLHQHRFPAVEALYSYNELFQKKNRSMKKQTEMESFFKLPPPEEEKTGKGGSKWNMKILNAPKDAYESTWQKVVKAYRTAYIHHHQYDVSYQEVIVPERTTYKTVTNTLTNLFVQSPSYLTASNRKILPDIEDDERSSSNSSTDEDEEAKASSNMSKPSGDQHQPKVSSEVDNEIVPLELQKKKISIRKNNISELPVEIQSCVHDYERWEAKGLDWMEGYACRNSCQVKYLEALPYFGDIGSSNPIQRPFEQIVIKSKKGLALLHQQAVVGLFVMSHDVL